MLNQNHVVHSGSFLECKVAYGSKRVEPTFIPELWSEEILAMYKQQLFAYPHILTQLGRPNPHDDHVDCLSYTP